MIAEVAEVEVVTEATTSVGLDTVFSDEDKLVHDNSTFYICK